jgi:beta-glucosidase
MVLLRNEQVDGRPLLPLDAAALRRVAVVGRLADLPNLGDRGSSDVRAPDVVTPLAGLRAALPGVEVTHAGDDPAAAVDAARNADVAVVVVGYTWEDEGEYVGSFDPALAALYPQSDDPSALDDLARVWDAGPQAVGGDRDSLRLRPGHEDLVRAVAAANPRTVVALMAGSAVVIESWRDRVPAVLVAWYPGMEGGAALANVLLGAAEPGGRLPFAVPVDESHLPAFDRNATSATYDRWHGQRLLDRDGHTPAFPLGFGLGYTSFALGDLLVEQSEDHLDVQVSVANTGERAGRHVVQVYALPDDGRTAQERVLLGFAAVRLDHGERRDVRIRAALSPLTTRVGPRHWRLRDGTYRIEVGSFAGDPGALTQTVRLTGLRQ